MQELFIPIRLIQNSTIMNDKKTVHHRPAIHFAQNFQYLFPYFQYISKKSHIFVMHFQPIGVMKLVESVFYFLYGVKNVLSL